jgi:ankyrin repeat/BTB/POZ domain-containing protein 2
MITPITQTKLTWQGFYGETQHWTALTYTALIGHCNIARILLERGATVEGGARPSEDKSTITPLQAATASGNNEMVALLLAHGAQPFLSTLVKDTFCYSGSAQRGCYRYGALRCLVDLPEWRVAWCGVVWCGVAWRGAVWRGAVWRGVAGLGLILIGDRRSAISVATAHGQRSCLHQLLSHPLNFSARRGEKEVLSLEEILAEGNSGTSQLSGTDGRGNPRDGSEPVFSKAQSKALQEAMYHSVESNHLGMI